MAAHKPLEQRIIVYGTGNGVVYDTVYTDEQMSAAMNRCVRAYGRRAQVRCLPCFRRRVQDGG